MNSSQSAWKLEAYVPTRSLPKRARWSPTKPDSPPKVVEVSAYLDAQLS